VASVDLVWARLGSEYYWAVGSRSRMGTGRSPGSFPEASPACRRSTASSTRKRLGPTHDRAPGSRRWSERRQLATSLHGQSQTWTPATFWSGKNANTGHSCMRSRVTEFGRKRLDRFRRSMRGSGHSPRLRRRLGLIPCRPRAPTRWLLRFKSKCSTRIGRSRCRCPLAGTLGW